MSPLEKQNWIYHTNIQNSARYALGLQGYKMLACVGVNPSTAEPGNLDATMQSVNRISKNNGYDGWLMFNLYPQRTTDPKGLHKRVNNKLFEENIIIIKELIDRYGIRDIWLAWGNLITFRPYLPKACSELLTHIQILECDSWKVGKINKSGHPGHPLYKRADAKLEPFCSHSYLQEYCSA